MFTITTMFKPATVKFLASEKVTFAGFDEEIAIVDIDDIEENDGLPIDPALRRILAGASADELYDFLQETPHF